MSDHTIERELRQPTPRKVKNRDGIFGTVRPFWWILLPHTWIAVAAPVILTWMIWVSAFPGYRLQAEITGHHTSPTRKGGTIYSVTFKYQLDGEPHTATSSVGHDLYNEIEQGRQTIPIEVNKDPLGGRPYARVPNHSEEPLMLGFGILWTTVWTGAIGFLAYTSCAPSLQSRSLVANGTAAVGTVTDQTIKRGSKGARIPIVTFSYSARLHKEGLAKPTEIVSKMKVSLKDYEKLTVGDRVTVLYHPNRPTNSIIYACGDYRATV